MEKLISQKVLPLLSWFELDIEGIARNIPCVEYLATRVGDFFQPIYQMSLEYGKTMSMERPDLCIINIGAYFLMIIAFSYRFIPLECVKIKHLMNIILGLFFSFFSFGLFPINACLMSMIGYLLLRFFALFGKKNKTNLLILTLVTVVISSTHMMLIQVHVFLKDLGSNHEFPAVVLTEYHVIRVLSIPLYLWEEEDSEFPSLLQYLSYQFFFGTILVGPFIKIKDFLSFMETKKKIPFDGKLILRKFFGMSSLALLGYLMNIYGVPCYTLHFGDEVSFLCVVKNMFLFMFMTRCLIQSAFYTGELFCAIVGLGNGGEPTNNSSLLDGSDVLGYEFALTPRKLMKSWNISIWKAIRYTTYERLPVKNKILKVMLPMTMMGLVHGIYPGYIAMWLSVGLFHLCYIDVYRKVRPRLVGKGYEMSLWMKVLLWFICHFFVDYFTVSFTLLKPQQFLGFFGRFYFLPHIVVLIAFVGLKFVPSVNKSK